MNNEKNPIKMDANAKRAWISPVSDELIDDPMEAKLSEGELSNYGNDYDVMENITRNKIKGLIVEEADRSHAKRTQAEVLTQIEETFVDMLQICSTAALNGIETEFLRSLEAIVVKWSRCGAAKKLRWQAWNDGRGRINSQTLP